MFLLMLTSKISLLLVVIIAYSDIVPRGQTARGRREEFLRVAACGGVHLHERPVGRDEA